MCLLRWLLFFFFFVIILTEPTILPCLTLSLCLTSVSVLCSSLGIFHVQHTTFLFYDNYFSCAQSSESYHIKIQFEDESVWRTIDVCLLCMCVRVLVLCTKMYASQHSTRPNQENCIFTAPELNEMARCVNARLFEWNEWMEQTLATYVVDHRATGSFAVHTSPCTYVREAAAAANTSSGAVTAYRRIRFQYTPIARARYAARQSILVPLDAIAIHSIQFRIWPTSVRVRCSYRTDHFSFFLCSVHFLFEIYNLVEERKRTIKVGKNTQESSKNKLK